MRAYERLLDYVVIHTTSDEESETVFAYEVRTILLDEESSEELRELLKENPKLKQW